MEEQILKQAKDFNVYRGQEYTSNQLEIYKHDLAESQLFKYVITHKNEKYKRFKYGEEIKLSSIPEAYSSKYCGDCAVVNGEYHLTGCDWEMCPVCKGQLFSCGCIDIFSE